MLNVNSFLFAILLLSIAKVGVCQELLLLQMDIILQCFVIVFSYQTMNVTIQYVIVKRERTAVLCECLNNDENCWL